MIYTLMDFPTKHAFMFAAVSKPTFIKGFGYLGTTVDEFQKRARQSAQDLEKASPKLSCRRNTRLDSRRGTNISAAMSTEDHSQAFAERLTAATKERLAANPRSRQNVRAKAQQARGRYRKLKPRKQTERLT